jgi:DNA-binding GntR family transcriptional regulator
MAAAIQAAESPDRSRQKPTMAESAYREIQRLILDSQLPAGTVVSERLLADRLGSSKAPVRAALIRLAEEGFVSIASRQGIVIRAPSIRDLIEMFEMRVALEALIVRSIAGRLSSSQVAQVRSAVDQCRRVAETADPNDVISVESIAADFGFHRLLCEFHGNQQIARALERIFNSLYRELRTIQSKFPNRLWGNVEEHQAVADAVIAGDASGAERLMKAHLQYGEQFVLSRGTSWRESRASAADSSGTRVL